MNRVAVFGGGMGGLAAAHELVERGFEVDIYERRALWGGKARSYGVHGTGVAGGNLLIGAKHASAALTATEAAVTAIAKESNVILPFPGGIVPLPENP